MRGKARPLISWNYKEAWGVKNTERVDYGYYVKFYSITRQSTLLKTYFSGSRKGTTFNSTHRCKSS